MERPEREDREVNAAVRLAIAPGHGQLLGWLCLAFFGFLATVTLLRGMPVVAGIPAVFAGLGIIAIELYRRPRFLVADDRGVRKLWGNRTLREIPWPEVREIRYGTRVIPIAGPATREGVFLTVYGRGFGRRIDFDTQEFGLSDADLARFAGQIANLAAVHGIPTRPVLAGTGA